MLRNYDYFCCLGVLIVGIWRVGFFFLVVVNPAVHFGTASCICLQLYPALKRITPNLPQCERRTKRGGVCVSHEGIFGIRPTGAIGFWRGKMHVHIRRQHLVLGPYVQMLAWSLLPHKRNAPALLWFCGWHWVSVQRALGMSETSAWEVEARWPRFIVVFLCQVSQEERLGDHKHLFFFQMILCF